MLQTANALKSNFTRPIGCRVLAVKCSKKDHLNLEECTRQLTRMMDLMLSDFAAVNSTLPACAMIQNQQNFRRHDERLNFTTIFSNCQIGQVHVTFITVSNSPNPSRVYIRLCKHVKRFLLLN